MKILILGASGMIGHKMYQVLSKTFNETYASFRRPFADVQALKIFDPLMTYAEVDLSKPAELDTLLRVVCPDVIINCVGITLRRSQISNLDVTLELNSMLPHRLKCWAASAGGRIIHFSTDCVFDGKSALYVEESPPTATDNYGRTKFLGEIQSDSSLTLRGSMIGREIFEKSELLEWALSQKGKAVVGFSAVLYSGVTTDVMAQFVLKILLRPTFPTGLYQVSSDPISKGELLEKINSKFRLGMTITQDCSYVSKKVLDSSKIRRELGFVCPSWDEMINQLASETI